ncbi:MAG: ABC transporter transmembrane domain-containing protein, partial [Pseudomonadota bacterium]
METIKRALSLDPLFRWLEARVDPFDPAEPVKPPTTFWAFIWHYAYPFRWLLLTTITLTTITAVLEVLLFAWIGSVVDWIAAGDRATFFDTHGSALLWLGAFALIFLPIIKLVDEAVINVGMLGNFPMRNRWEGHRYLLRQSMQFFQDDFAGRVATKVMQSAIAVREVVIKASEVMCYVIVYFVTSVVLFAAADWRLALPMIAWIAGYGWALWYFVPKLAAISEEQADRRSVVTGRIVDSYTNIATVKMFANARAEDDYARDGMEPFLDNVYRQMRLATWLTATLNIMNAALIVGVAGFGIWLWSLGSVTAGAIAFAVGLVFRLQGMAHWILWETTSL